MLICRIMRHIPPLTTIRLLRLGASIQFGTDSECWPWKGVIGDAGYGVMKIDGISYGAHRVVAAVIYGPHADWVEVVRHTCDNPVCVNPRHLVYDTQAGNVRDCVQKGRFVSNLPVVRAYHRGPDNPISKLSIEDVRAIRAAYDARTESQDALAKRFGVSQSRISFVVRRKTYQDIE